MASELIELIELRDEASVSLVRTEVRTLGASIGMSREGVEWFASAASEVGFNQLNHARAGRISIECIERAGHRGLELVAVDGGPGIRDPPAALAGRLVGTGLGVGLAAVRRAVDEIDTDVRHGEGSTLVLRRFVRDPNRPLAPRHPEVAIEGRPYPGEPACGDHAVCVRDGSGFLVAVADGLGHGREARIASERAMHAVRGFAGLPLPELLAEVHEAVKGTRGLALTVARYDATTERIRLCGLGNIDSVVVDRDQTHHHVPRSGTVGVRLVGAPPPVRVFPFPQGAMLRMCTDGIRVRDADDTPGISFRPAVWTAHHLLNEHARATDDALVLTAK